MGHAAGEFYYFGAKCMLSEPDDCITYYFILANDTHLAITAVRELGKSYRYC
jgi:hypothetical protein